MSKPINEQPIVITIPPGTPRELERLWRQLGKQILEVDAAYRWAWSYAGYPGTGSGDKVAIKGEPNDPTGSRAVSGIPVKGQRPKGYEAVRRSLQHACDTTEEAISALRSVLFTLDHAVPDREPAPSMLEPSFLTRGQRAESHAAKARREGRGEGWGNG